MISIVLTTIIHNISEHYDIFMAPYFETLQNENFPTLMQNRIINLCDREYVTLL
jgi:hypothetical protein